MNLENRFLIVHAGATPTLDTLPDTVDVEEASGAGLIVYTVDFNDADTLEAGLLSVSIQSASPTAAMIVFSVNATTGKTMMEKI